MIEALAECGAAEAVRQAAHHPSALSTHSRPHAARWYRPLLEFVVLALVPTVPLFRLHQWITYGGTFGEYYTYGLQAYLLGFAAYWWTFTIYLVLYAAGLRALAEAVVMTTAWTAPARVATVRRIVETLDRILYSTIPLFLIRLALLSSSCRNARPAPLTPRGVPRLECARLRAPNRRATLATRRSAEAELLAARVPAFAGAWLVLVALITVIETLQGRLNAGLAVAFLVLHATIVGGLVAWRAIPNAQTVVIALGGGLAASVAGTFASFGGSAEILGALLFALTASAAAFFCWGWQAQLALNATTAVVWLLALPRLGVSASALELVGVTVIGWVITLGLAETMARTLRSSVELRERERAATDALRNPTTPTATSPRTRAISSGRRT